MRSLPIGLALLLLFGGSSAAARPQDDSKQEKQQKASGGQKTIKATPLISPGAIKQAQDAKKDQDPVDDSIQGRVDGIISEFNRKMRDFSKAYGAAENDEQRSKIVQESYPQPNDYSARLLELGREEPSDPGSLTAFLWIVQSSGPSTEKTAAMELLLQHHLDSDQMGDVAMSLMYAPPSAETDLVLTKLINQSPHEKVKGLAAYARAVYLKRAVTGFENQKSKGVPIGEQLENAGIEISSLVSTGSTTDGKSIEDLFEDLAKNYADIILYGKKTIGAAAEGALFESRYLSIGKVVPEIAGEDIDGTEFKLSDYRGKVVMLDFWGDW